MKVLKNIFAIAVFSVFFLACSSVPKEIPEDLSYPEIIQMGQTDFESSKYKSALVYFNTAIERFGEDITKYVEAKYEIAHLYMKQKKYEEAEPILNELVEIYRNSTPGAIPAAYDKLAQLELAKIKEKPETPAKRNKR